MDRMTYWNNDYDCWDCHCPISEAVKRLAAYENMGLRPSEIKELLQKQEEEEKNDPLTLEDLKSMDGNPVWVDSQERSGWYLVSLGGGNDNTIWIDRYGVTLCANRLIGKYWKFYRYPPKEGEKK